MTATQVPIWRELHLSSARTFVIALELRPSEDKMKRLFAAMLIGIALGSVSWAQATHQSTTTQNTTTQTTSTTTTHHHRTYTNSSGEKVKSPEHSSTVPADATARCADGTYSFSKHHRGTCSHHGGVSQWLR